MLTSPLRLFLPPFFLYIPPGLLYYPLLCQDWHMIGSGQWSSHLPCTDIESSPWTASRLSRSILPLAHLTSLRALLLYSLVIILSRQLAICTTYSRMLAPWPCISANFSSAFRQVRGHHWRTQRRSSTSTYTLFPICCRYRFLFCVSIFLVFVLILLSDINIVDW